MEIPSTPAPPGHLKSIYRSIMREQNTPGSGRSVRWGARNAFRTITPETSANTTSEGVPTVPSTPLLEHEEHTSFLDRLQNESREERSPTGRQKIEQLAVLGQSVGAKLTAAPSITTTPPSPGPAPLSKSTAPIPRPRFNSTMPSSSSPLARDDSSLYLPHSMSPAQEYSISHRPFDMSRDLEAIPMSLGDESVARDGDTRFDSNAGDPPSVAPPPISNETTAGGMTTQYPPGMFNLTKTQQRVPSFSIDPDSSGEKTTRTRMSVRPKKGDTTGSSSLDFITASGGSGRSTPGPGPTTIIDPSIAPHSHSKSLSLSGSRSNFLSRATTTAPPREMLASTDATAREMPTLYPPGYAKFNQTTVVQIDPENIPELTRFFTPMLGDESTRVNLEPESQLDAMTVPEATDIPLPMSPPSSLSGSTTSLSSSSVPTPLDLTMLIETQYKADLAAHAALVPVLLARAESAESSARRLAGVVEEAKGRVKELETLCIELGEEVGVLRQEKEWLLKTERTELVAQVTDLSSSDDKIELSEENIRNIDTALRRAEIEASRSRKRKQERDAARLLVKDLERRLNEMYVRERDWEVRVERERDGQGARERVQVEKEGWEREKVELLDRCVRAEKALADVQVGQSTGTADDKLRQELENYKAEVQAQWKYAEQAEEKNRRLEEEIKMLRSQARSSSPKNSQSHEADWKAREAEWSAREDEWRAKEAAWRSREAEWERERQDWVPTRRFSELQTQITDLQAERDALAGDMNHLDTELERMGAEMDALQDRARHAEEMYVGAQKEIEKADAKVKELEAESRSRSPDQRAMRRLEQEREEMLDAVKGAEDRLREMEERAQTLEARCAKAEAERKDVLRDRAELEDELERLRVRVEDGVHSRNQAEQERNALTGELASQKAAHAALVSEHDQLVRQFDEIERERQVALENQQRLEGVVRTRNQEIAEVEERLLVQSRETEQLRAASRELEKIKVQRDDAIQAEEHLRAQLEGRQSVEVKALRDKVAKLTDDTARLQRRVNELKAESADKEVKIVQLNKARALEAEDREGLNVALQSKQQELELIKRKLGVRGTAGATPAPGRVARLGSTRRESIASSAAFETPMPRAALALREVAPPSDSTASVLSSSVSSNLHSVSTNPLQTSTRANIYSAMSSTPATVKPVRSSLRGFSSLSVSGIRGVHFAPTESETETDESDVTIQQL
ncbi:hypothetical protein RhiLY_05049 [Ceratobasidium sp. AG-Ba]|nr:hypothetical protein RhiLY_05049 [Ceratobasidium sp. AG-Ba]